jgi:disulfide bond formation protein DsbB
LSAKSADPARDRPLNLALLHRFPAVTLAAMAAVSVGAVAVALVSQHVFDMQPCPWCVLQRLVFVLIALAAGTGALWRRPAGRAAAAAVAGLLALAGAAAALWQHFVAAASSSCKRTLADRIVSGLQLDALAPEVFAPRASCAEAAVDLLGVPYEFWSLALFVLLAAAATALVLGTRRPHQG